MSALTNIVTDCSGCMEEVVINLNPRDLSGRATVQGQSTHVFYEGGDMEQTYSLIMWDCPNCNEADSYDRNYAEE